MPFWLACVWAVLAGVSVTLQVGAGIVLNNTSSPKLAHAAYVTVGNLAMGALWLMLLAILQGGNRPSRPKHLWSTWGGMVILPAFVCTPAAALLGTQLTLTLLLVGMMVAAFLFDFCGTQLRVSRYFVLCIVLLLAAVCLQILIALPTVHGSDLRLVVYIFGSVLAGGCYSMQAKMNNRLACDLGSSARAAAWCNVTAMLWGLPLCWVLVDLHVPLDFVMKDWWIWLLLGLQSAFYTYSLAELPKVLGYSVMFILVITGKMCFAAFADTMGLFAKPLVLSPWRYLSVVATLMGAASFAFNQAKHPSQVRPRQEEIPYSCEQDLHDSLSEQ